jgi:hypothetical protein
MSINLEEEVERLLTLMTLSDCRPDPAEEMVPMSYFNDADPFNENFIKCAVEDRTFIHPDTIKMSDLESPLDVSLIRNMIDGDGKVDPNGFALSRVRSVPPKAIRGKCIYHSNPIEHTQAFVTTDGIYHCFKLYIGYREVADKVSVSLLNHKVKSGPGGKLAQVLPRTTEQMSNEEAVIGVAKTVQFGRRYDWRVSLGYIDGPTIAFVTDPLGAKEIFKLRDIPEGKKRRAALKNWVMEHWRKNRKDEGEHQVRKHLRGAEKFTWNGIRCCIMPAQYDLEVNEMLAAER